MEKLNVLSLFDGMSCGQQALLRAKIKYDKYYASEIDKYAIQVTQHNYPDTIQLGSVTEVNVEELEPIDLLIGGSPCQSFSFAGKRNGMTTSCNEEIYTLNRYLELKSDGFQFEGESYLFWEYMRILTDIRKYNPDVLFLLENVEMGAKWERVLSEAIGIYGVHINSALVSAQNRKRIYWTNIRVREDGLFGELHSDIPQPEDRDILLKDILEYDVDEKYYISSKSELNFVTDKWRIDKKYTQINGEKGLPQMARQYSSWCGDYVCDYRAGEHFVSTPDNLNERQRINYKSGDENANSFLSTSYKGAQANGMTLVGNARIRRLTPVECERLQTVEDNYTACVSDTQRYKMLGNGWTVDVIAHIFSFINNGKT